MLNKREYAVVSKKAIEEGYIGYAYRDAGTSGGDSGWRMMHGKDEDRLALANPDKVYTCTIKNLLRHFPEVEEILKEKRGTIAELSGGAWDIRRDKSLDSVENKMTGKQKYIKSVVSGSGISPIVTANPDELRTLGKDAEAWEALLPEGK